MKVLVTGGRDYADAAKVYETLGALHGEDRAVSLVIHGDARGADRLADNWATEHGVQPVRCPALWDFYSNGAGPIRNSAMLLLKPDLVVAFPGGTGTADMIRAAREAGIDVLEA